MTSKNMDVRIQNFEDSDSEAFLRLNKFWVEKYFSYEPSDAAQLEDPQTHILAKGGKILIAHIEDKRVGTVAIIPKPELGARTVEMVKMCVHPDFYGLGIGTALMQRIIETAQSMGVERIWLETNDRLKAATAIYHKFGFNTLKPSECKSTEYTRCNLQMEFVLARPTNT